MADASESALLLAAVASADEVVVVVGSEFDVANRSANEILGRAAGRESLDDLLEALSFGPGERMDWMTLGTPTLAFLHQQQLLAAVQCVLPDYVRCPQLWAGDIPLLGPESLQSWFRRHGIPWDGDAA